MSLTETGNGVCIEQTGNDCNVTIRGAGRIIKNCNALKLALTMFNKPGEKYTVQEMYDFGFGLKGIRQ